MATRAEDQVLVADAAVQYGVTFDEIHATQSSPHHRVIPAFGWHPWFSYQVFFQSDHGGVQQLSPQQKLAHYRQVLAPTPREDDFLQGLPDPRPFEEFLSSTERYFAMHSTALLGEVGLDKSFRIPHTWLPEELSKRDPDLTPGGREGRKLLPYRVDIDHQRRILLAQLALAGRYKRAASVHGVQAHGILHDTLAAAWKGFERRTLSKRQLKRRQAEHVSASDEEEIDTREPPFPPRICLHSYSGPAETVKLYTASTVPCDVYFSFSVTINSWAEDGNGKVEAAVRAVPADRILMESDLHTAGKDMDNYLQHVAHKICSIKRWTITEGTAQLARNWKRFVTGSEGPAD